MLLGEELLEVLVSMELLSDKDIARLYARIITGKNRLSCESLFRKLIILKPNSYEARRCLAECLMLSLKFKEAANEWQKINLSRRIIAF
ncbi:hypothetical protein [Selenomonas sp. AB3002]|uniref:hypothetical protein n=1 Tax=Selenomonas sp. AB3002 TaxID=1392502 RepID=UPI00163AC256